MGSFGTQATRVVASSIGAGTKPELCPASHVLPFAKVGTRFAFHRGVQAIKPVIEVIELGTAVARLDSPTAKPQHLDAGASQ